MRKLYSPRNVPAVKSAAKRMSIEHNVTFNVIDQETGKVVQTHEGHNAATNSLLTGIAHYLIGDGIYNQGYDLLSMYVPKYISLGTMGLFTQDEDSYGLPIGLGSDTDVSDDSKYVGDGQTERLCHYISECPGFGADGYDESENGNRPYFGLGPKFEDRAFLDTISCELVSDAYPRSPIAFRDIVPESEAEIPKTIDVIYSAMISTGALAQFRGYTPSSAKRNYIFITEAGLWSSKTPTSDGNNGLLAGYRIVPPNQSNWDLGTYIPADSSTNTPAHYELDPDDADHAIQQKANQELLKQNILRVGVNQVVQVIWKIQIGGLDQLGGMSELYPSLDNALVWHIWDDDSNIREYESIDAFPPRGDPTLLYLDMSTGILYRWSSVDKRYEEI